MLALYRVSCRLHPCMLLNQGKPMQVQEFDGAGMGGNMAGSMRNSMSDSMSQPVVLSAQASACFCHFPQTRLTVWNLQQLCASCDCMGSCNLRSDITEIEGHR